MAELIKVSFIGSGNLAWHLAPALDNIGYVVKEVYSLHTRHAEALTGRLYQAEVKKDLDFSDSDSKLFIMAVSDDAMEEVATEMVLPDEAILIHTSGTQPLNVLDFAGVENMGSFYPLQTFTKNKKVDFKTIPIFIESNNDLTGKLLMKIAKSLSNNVQKITSEERRALHVAAVFASNFTNHMITLSKDILDRNGLSFDLVKPLINETLTKSFTVGPEKAQTGPAVRSDLEILDRHLEFLSDDENVAEIYKLISQNIIDRYAE